MVHTPLDVKKPFSRKTTLPAIVKKQEASIPLCPQRGPEDNAGKKSSQEAM
jgi:hypothetical protein